MTCSLVKHVPRNATVTSSHTGPVNTATQIDFILFRKSLRKLFMDVKVIPGEEVALQHQLLVWGMMIDMPPQIKCKFTQRPKVKKLRDPQTCSPFQEVFKAHVPEVETEAATTTEEIWAKLKTGLLKTTEEVCGTTKPHPELLIGMRTTYVLTHFIQRKTH